MKRKKQPSPSPEDLKPTANLDQETTTDSGSKGKLGRRGFLKVGAGAAAGVLATPLESIAQQRPPTQLQARLTGECNDVPFTEPKAVFACTNNGKNELEYYLSAEPLNWTYTCAPNPDPQPGLQPVFNGALPGPSLYVDPGTTINLTLKNNLGAFKFGGDTCKDDGHHEPPSDGSPPTPACFQHTNLHFHGFQVSPCSIDSEGKKHCGPIAINDKNKLQFSSDDVLVDIFPGYSNTYRVVLPDMHAPGTCWYHSHLHGASGFQVSGGMAGAIIIREPTPEARIVRDDLDKVFVLQEVQANKIVPTRTPPLGQFPPVYGALGGGDPPTSQVFVNGLCRPTLKMNAGQTMRWRFINTTGTPRGLMKLRLVKSNTCTSTFPDPSPPLSAGEVMFLIAIDGLSFYGINPQPVRYHIMGSGNRADFLVNLEPGLYTLLKDGFPLQSVLDPDSGQFTAASDGSKQVLMYIDVQPSSYKENIPTQVPIIPGKKPAYLNPIWNLDGVKDIVRKEPIKFQNDATGSFKIDGGYYDNNTPISVPLNTAQQWTLQNIGFAKSPGGQTNTHPFHVHLNPFQILGVPFDFEVTDADLKQFFPKVQRWNPSDPCGWPFWDTVPLPAQIPPGSGTTLKGELQIRSRFLIYDGEYVTHCHILIHEDVGMMINVKLIGDGIDPGVPVHDYPEAARLCIERTSRCPGDTKP